MEWWRRPYGLPGAQVHGNYRSTYASLEKNGVERRAIFKIRTQKKHGNKEDAMKDRKQQQEKHLRATATADGDCVDEQP